ncbi:helix-turn-helix domain-containing protein [Haloarcula sp. S1CR25-12]|uniref:Helix-turn-helix domain-containing protein n=1 Tax=Haloarcula saliterrae TaxID=2950534 RepID=A0ABU2FD91_9EURY|nr:bacterio-opsin activator domain-containing protein [Haloarcula sp. S1CR25-12]MDS0259786.1 helix-turn-helix domain-containing protein [Haloarcula sp. S1CR25-12]
MSTGADVLGARGYERLRRAAETHREDLVVRLGAEVGLRPTEMTGVRLADIATAGDHHFLAVRDGETATREAYLPSDVEHDVRKFASAAGRDDDEPLLSVSARRLQMLVGEVADRAGETDPRLADVSSRDLRWRFAASLLAEGVPVHVVCALGGWKRLDRLDPLLDDPDRETVVSAVDGVETDAAPARLRRTIGVASEVGAALSEAATGEEIARTLCDRLAATEGFRFAWVAEHTGDGLTPRAIAGVGEQRVTEQRRAHAGVATDAIDANDVRPVEGANGPVVLVPLVREDAVSGVLAVGTTARLGDAEREVLRALGTHIGAALSAVERKRLLLADTVTELTFRCTDADAVTVGLSETLGCRVELSGVVPVGGRSLLYYLVVDGAPTDAVLSYVTDDAATVDARLIEDYRDGALLEVVVTAAPTLPLVENGGRIRDLTARHGDAVITAELPTDIDLRDVVDTVVGAYPGTTLTAKHETERPVETDRGFREHLSDRLSDRQATVLQAAYHSGYFEWPRGTTAEELADSLAISAPTLHNHLRKAQQKLLTAFFAEESETPSKEAEREV